MILSIIGIVMGLLAIGLFFWLKKDQQMNNALYEGELEAAEHGFKALMEDFTNYQIQCDRELSRLEKQLEYKNNKVNKRIDINENELPKVIRKIVGHIEFARPLDKK
jgi:hypothetical protein